MVVTLDHNGNAVCESCGKAFIDHPGIIGTCTEVQRLKQIIKDALAIYHTPQSPKTSALDCNTAGYRRCDTLKALQGQSP